MQPILANARDSMAECTGTELLNLFLSQCRTVTRFAASCEAARKISKSQIAIAIRKSQWKSERAR